MVAKSHLQYFKKKVCCSMLLVSVGENRQEKYSHHRDSSCVTVYFDMQTTDASPLLSELGLVIKRDYSRLVVGN